MRKGMYAGLSSLRAGLLGVVAVSLGVGGCLGSGGSGGSSDNEEETLTVAAQLGVQTAEDLVYPSTYYGMVEQALVNSPEDAARVADFVYLGERLRTVRDLFDVYLDAHGEGSDIDGECGGTADYTVAVDPAAGTEDRTYSFENFCLSKPADTRPRGQVTITGDVEVEQTTTDGTTVETWSFQDLVYELHGVEFTLSGALQRGEHSDIGDHLALAMDVTFEGSTYRFLSNEGTHVVESRDPYGFRDIKAFLPTMGSVDARERVWSAYIHGTMVDDFHCPRTVGRVPLADNGGLKFDAAREGSFEMRLGAGTDICGDYQLSGTYSHEALGDMDAEHFTLLETLLPSALSGSPPEVRQLAVARDGKIGSRFKVPHAAAGVLETRYRGFQVLLRDKAGAPVPAAATGEIDILGTAHNADNEFRINQLNGSDALEVAEGSGAVEFEVLIEREEVSVGDEFEVTLEYAPGVEVTFIVEVVQRGDEGVE